MDVFSLLDGVVRKLSKDQYIKSTGKRFPYYQGNGKHYALCPACKNPVLIINLYGDKYVEDKTGRTRLHARHNTQNVKGLAKYDEYKYNNCPLSNRLALDLKKKRENHDECERLEKIINCNKDVICKQIRRIIGVNLSDEYIYDQIDEFLRGGNVDLQYVNEFNLPYTMLYITSSVLLFGRLLNEKNKVGSKISQSICEKSKYFYVNNRKIEKRTEIKSFAKINLEVYEYMRCDKIFYIKFRIIEFKNYEYDKNKYKRTILDDKIEVDLSLVKEYRLGDVDNDQ